MKNSISVRDNFILSFKNLKLLLPIEELPIKKNWNKIHLESNFRNTQSNQSIQVLMK